MYIIICMHPVFYQSLYVSSGTLNPTHSLTVDALDKLLTPVCLCHQAVSFGTGQRWWCLWLGK